jgi:hypothetical protein
MSFSSIGSGKVVGEWYGKKIRKDLTELAVYTDAD